jgi:hypothetical protein
LDTNRAHLEGLEAKGIPLNEDSLEWVRKARDVPPFSSYLLEILWEITGRGDMAGFYSELYAFCALEHLDLEPWEIAILRALDRKAQTLIAEKLTSGS